MANYYNVKKPWQYDSHRMQSATDIARASIEKRSHRNGKAQKGYCHRNGGGMGKRIGHL